MKPLTYNSPERAKERAECVPPTTSEIQYVVQRLSNDYKGQYEPLFTIQRILDDYANLIHFRDVSGGWQGLNALQVNYEIVKC